MFYIRFGREIRVNGNLVDADSIPTVEIIRVLDNLVVVSQTSVGVVHDGTGKYHYDFSAGDSGQYYRAVWRFVVGGVQVTASSDQLFGKLPLCGIGVEDYRNVTGDVASSDVEVEAAIAACLEFVKSRYGLSVCRQERFEKRSGSGVSEVLALKLLTRPVIRLIGVYGGVDPIVSVKDVDGNPVSVSVSADRVDIARHVNGLVESMSLKRSAYATLSDLKSAVELSGWADFGIDDGYDGLSPMRIHEGHVFSGDGGSCRVSCYAGSVDGVRLDSERGLLVGGFWGPNREVLVHYESGFDIVPAGLVAGVSRLSQKLKEHASRVGIKSERLGDYSVSFSDAWSSGDILGDPSVLASLYLGDYVDVGW